MVKKLMGVHVQPFLKMQIILAQKWLNFIIVITKKLSAEIKLDLVIALQAEHAYGEVKNQYRGVHAKVVILVIIVY